MPQLVPLHILNVWVTVLNIYTMLNIWADVLNINTTLMLLHCLVFGVLGWISIKYSVTTAEG